MADPAAIPRAMSDTGADLLAAILFTAFVVLLFWGYLYPGPPYSEISAIPFAGSLVTVLWANITADRRSCALPLPPEPSRRSD
jgi:hypothetical protein